MFERSQHSEARPAARSPRSVATTFTPAIVFINCALFNKNTTRMVFYMGRQNLLQGLNALNLEIHATTLIPAKREYYSLTTYWSESR